MRGTLAFLFAATVTLGLGASQVPLSSAHASTMRIAIAATRVMPGSRSAGVTTPVGQVVLFDRQIMLEALYRHRQSDAAQYLASLESAAAATASLHAAQIAEALETATALGSSQAQAAAATGALPLVPGGPSTLPDVISTPTTPVSMLPSASDPPGDTVTDYQRAAWRQGQRVRARWSVES